MDLMILGIFSNINDSMILQQFCKKVLFYIKILSSCGLVCRFSNISLNHTGFKKKPQTFCMAFPPLCQ